MLNRNTSSTECFTLFVDNRVVERCISSQLNGWNLGMDELIKTGMVGKRPASQLLYELKCWMTETGPTTSFNQPRQKANTNLQKFSQLITPSPLPWTTLLHKEEEKKRHLIDT